MTLLLTRTMGGAYKNKPKRRPLTPQEREEALKIRSIYEAKKRELRLTQETLAEKMGFGTQGAVSQYMQGRIPMSNEVLLRFAYHLEFDPCDLRPDIFEKIPLSNIDTSAGLDKEALTWARQFARLREEDRKYLMELIRRLAPPEQ